MELDKGKGVVRSSISKDKIHSLSPIIILLVLSLPLRGWNYSWKWMRPLMIPEALGESPRRGELEINVVLGPTVGPPRDGVTSDRNTAGADVARCWIHRALWITNFFRTPWFSLAPVLRLGNFPPFASFFFFGKSTKLYQTDRKFSSKIREGGWDEFFFLFCKAPKNQFFQLVDGRNGWPFFSPKTFWIPAAEGLKLRDVFFFNGGILGNPSRWL